MKIIYPYPYPLPNFVCDAIKVIVSVISLIHAVTVKKSIFPPPANISDAFVCNTTHCTACNLPSSLDSKSRTLREGYSHTRWPL